MVEAVSLTPIGRERFRPSIHYTAEQNWLNDPNGLLYYKGLYHLFYQYNPRGNVWGNMSWGHASSPDLVNWTERPVAIEGDVNEEIFSGSIVVDAGNTSGFGRAGTVPLVAVYTSAFTEQSAFPGVQAQSLAYSLDEGATWAKYEGNPVLNRHSRDFRDPKVFRYEGLSERYWVMVAVEAEDRTVVLYRSDDLREWSFLSSFGPANATGGVWECPDLFPLAVDGDPDRLKWVLIVNLNPGGIAGGSGGQYFVGNFDGTTFTSESTIPKDSEGSDGGQEECNWLDWGRDYYAAVSFSGVPGDKPIMIAWMNNWDYGNDIPTHPWKSAMSLPREVSLITVRGVPRLLQRAIAVVPDPDEVTLAIDHKTVDEGAESLPEECWGSVLHIEAALTPGTAREIGLIVRGGRGEGTFIGYDVETGSVFVDRRHSGDVDFHPDFASKERAPADLTGGKIRLRIYVDHSSVEVFAQDGLVTITDQIFPEPSSREIAIYATHGSGAIDSLRIYNLERTTTPPTAAQNGPHA
ncbi:MULTISPECIES: glycoside hydrolase family 32 protein [unclassified Cryobacterium]|uniref:glycoside hydrolase family 32 protein n=1 Tax=unclassified Cryobacterium TaxID=2649013 RepID=UPI00106BAFCD|nr:MULTISPECIES: glycoside hydrolase family 32 protein [unclassified Cryobacterium]TFC00929.1 glycoside hydrolase family 32 protein [Cryobacterium sp. MDB2-A-1]TFC13109.1 glycoside hydrolase family 32 protein [Cryobacterium sp. MDB2-A-2]TFC23919.1 glycoside hydrolase family 32 protein [Cryobacterium sp. MDB2-10]